MAPTGSMPVDEQNDRDLFLRQCNLEMLEEILPNLVLCIAAIKLTQFAAGLGPPPQA
jgi:hypothetical protein